MANFKDLATASSARDWQLEGARRLVKVVNSHAREALLKQGTVTGYVTQERYLHGMTARQIERALGLRPFELRGLAFVYALARLPRPGEFEYHFSAAFPGGQPVGPGGPAGMTSARAGYDGRWRPGSRSHAPVVDYYPPGSAMVRQWRLTAPVELGPLVATVTDTLAFARESGSTKPYTPHNRGPVR